MGRAAHADGRGRGVGLSSKVIYSFSVSLDGFMESRDRKLDWVLVDEELHRFFNDEAREVGTFVYGRRLYELMVDFWPTADSDPSLPGYMADFARIWRDKPKLVFSKTLKSVKWNSRLASDGLAEEIARLKADPGGDIAIGGASLAAAAIKLDLIDEYRLSINPVVLGAGTPFFPGLDSALGLRLIESRTFGSGVVNLRYERSRS
jgi:dihydrofolate reductase